MNLVNLTGVAIRVIAVIALVTGVRTSIVALSYVWSDASQDAHAPYFITAAVWILAAAVLWIFAQRFARALTKDTGSDDSKAGVINSEDFEVLLLTVLGIYFLFNAAVDITYWLSAAVWHSRSFGADLDLGVDQKAAILSTFLELVMAIVIVLRARGLSNLIRRMRETGNH